MCKSCLAKLAGDWGSEKPIPFLFQGVVTGGDWRGFPNSDIRARHARTLHLRASRRLSCCASSKICLHRGTVRPNLAAILGYVCPVSRRITISASLSGDGGTRAPRASGVGARFTLTTTTGSVIVPMPSQRGHHCSVIVCNSSGVRGDPPPGITKMRRWPAHAGQVLTYMPLRWRRRGNPPGLGICQPRRADHSSGRANGTPLARSAAPPRGARSGRRGS